MENSKQTAQISEDISQSPNYIRSRKGYNAHAALEYFVALIMQDAFLAKLLSGIGLSDTTIGIISSLIMLAFLFQLAAIPLEQKIRNVKATAISIHMVAQLIFPCLYFIPLLNVSKELREVLVVGGILVAYFCNYLVTATIFKWSNSFVSPKKRAIFSAKKEMISLIAGMAFTFTVGYFVDRFDEIGNVKGSFIFLGIMGLVSSILNFISLLAIAKPKESASESVNVESNNAQEKTPMKTVLKNLFSNKSFLCVIVIKTLWDMARYTTIGFMGIYKIKDLLLTVGTVQVINIVANLIRFMLSPSIGKFSDKTSYARGIEMGLTICAVAFAINMFTTPKSWFFVIAFVVIDAVGEAGIGQNLLNLPYSYVPKEYFVQATAIKNSIGGLMAFLMTLVSSRILDAIQKNGNMILGIPIHGQQVLSAISCIIIIAALIFDRKVLEKQPIMKQ